MTDAVRIAELANRIKSHERELAPMEANIAALKKRIESAKAELALLQPERAAHQAVADVEVNRRKGVDVGLKQNGPTVEEFVEAGYHPATYPPHGYASRSTDAEVQAAIDRVQAVQGSASADSQPETILAVEPVADTEPVSESNLAAPANEAPPAAPAPSDSDSGDSQPEAIEQPPPAPEAPPAE